MRFGGMTLDGNTVTCAAQDDWGETGAHCPTVTQLTADFHNIVTVADDEAFLAQAGEMERLVLETDQAIVTIDQLAGVQVKHKDAVCATPQPTLNFPWRCSATGGINDEESCIWHPGPAPSPTPTPTPTPPPSPPTPAAGWTLFKGLNCYNTAGARDLEPVTGQPCGTMSLQACEAKCDEMAECQGVTVLADGPNVVCYRRADIQTENCARDAPYDTWMKSSVRDVSFV